jgi:serine/threonine protein kinase
MFECADMTLSELWAKKPGEWTELPSEKISKWVASQAYGLAKALMKLHDFGPHRQVDDNDGRTHGLHGDLKPDNVLHYKNWTEVGETLGILQITDFGLSSFHYTQSAEDIVLRRGTSVYRPPEAAILSPLSASFDTWSLGCLFIEFLTWLVKGPEGLASFRNARLGSQGFVASHPCFWEVIEADKSTIVSLSGAVLNVSS